MILGGYAGVSAVAPPTAGSSSLVDVQRLHAEGVAKIASAILPGELATLRAIADSSLSGRPGARLYDHSSLAATLGPNGNVGRVAGFLLGLGARPVRAVLFDKSVATNWAVPWHQDRAIAVQTRREVQGFGPWSIKAGVPHVEPPIDILAAMVSLRIHLDACDIDNGPVLVAPGLHWLGRIPVTEVEAVARKLGSVACCAAAGDIWVCAMLIAHASERALRPSRRRVLQVDYAGRDLPSGLAWREIEARPVASAE